MDQLIRKTTALQLAAATICLGLLAPATRAADYPKLSPFNAVRWSNNLPQVQIQGQWFDLLAVNDLAAGQIVAACKEKWPRKWQKRFEEDLVEVLTRMGHKPGTKVNLRVRNVDSGDTVELPNVDMTAENRRALWEARRKLERTKDESTHDPTRILSAEEAGADIDQLLTAIESQYAYAKLKGFDYRKALDELRARSATGIVRKEFALELVKIMSRFGDGHTRVRRRTKFFPPGFLSFTIDDFNGRLVALRWDHFNLVDDQHPYLKSIDGVPAEEWVNAASQVVADGSPQFKRYRSIGTSHWPQLVRKLLGRPERDTATIELQNEAGDKTTALETELGIDPPRLVPPRQYLETDRMTGNIGYVYLPLMDGRDEIVNSFAEAMVKHRDTDGLIIDVRGNGGGTRDILREIFPYLMRPGDAPRVVNVAKYRLRPGERDDPQGHLQNRSLFPATWARWTPAERAAIESVRGSFKPQWTPPEPDFSSWHYMVISPQPERTGPCYDKPIVVLIDERCFSATDVFVGAFKGWRNVTLMGRPTGGGSGRSAAMTLANSALEVRLSTMASFLPDGRLYDGNGVQPDVPHKPTIEDLKGRVDTLMDAAVDHLRKQKKENTG